MRVVSFLGVALALFVGATGMLLPQLLRHRDHTTGPPPVFAGTTTVYAVPLAGGTVRPVLRLHGQWEFPVATRDGRALILERPSLARTDVWRVPLDGSRATRVARVRIFRAPPPRGRFVATEIESGSTAAGWRLDLHVRHAGVQVWTRRLPFPGGFPAASADGTTVAMVRMHLVELWTRTGHRILARDATQAWPPLWTRAGRSVIYETYADKRQSVVVRDVRTGRARTIARGRYFEPAISADGRTVYVLGVKEAVSIPK